MSREIRPSVTTGATVRSTGFCAVVAAVLRIAVLLVRRCHRSPGLVLAVIRMTGSTILFLIMIAVAKLVAGLAFVRVMKATDQYIDPIKPMISTGVSAPKAVSITVPQRLLWALR